jgi:hypothetical protein
VHDLTLKLAYAMIPLFWPIWLTTAAAAAWFACRAPLPWRSGRPLPGRSSQKNAALFLPYAVALVWGVEFAYHDNEVFIEYTVAGRPWPLAIWPHEGRYFPLFAQEYNVIGLLAANAVVYHAVVALQLLAFCWLIAMAVGDLHIGWRIAVTAILVLSNSVGISYVDLVYPERHVVFWLTLAIIALQRFDRVPSRMSLLAVWLPAHVAMYYKEPVFILFATVATMRLVIDCLRDRPAALSWLKGQQLNLGLLALSVVFVSQLVACLSAFGTSAYVDRATIGVVAATIRYLRTDPLLIGLCAAVVLRTSMMRGLADVDPVWDSLAVAAIVYVIALSAFGLAANRYMPPPDLIAALYIVRVAAASWTPSRRRVIRIAWAAVATASVAFGAFRLLEYKSVVRGTASLEQFLASYATAHPGTIALHFPGTKGWRIANLATYLRYRNRPLFDRVQLSSPSVFPDGRCVSYIAYAHCETAKAPPPEALVIHLPDDADRDGGNGERELFRYELLPGGVPQWLGALLYAGAELYEGRPMPAEWLSATASLP